MPEIIEAGTLQQTPEPWYTTTILICPACGCRFLLYAGDVVTDDHPGGTWVVASERLNGMTEASGPCPCCRTAITFQRPNLVPQGIEAPVYSRRDG